MKRVGIVYLITEAPEARGVLETVTETRRKTYCEEKSLSMSETYQARASGFAPTIRLVLPLDFEYRGETICEYRGERYNIIRDYRDEKTGVGTELTLERIRGNAAAPVTEPEGNGGDSPSVPTENGTEGAVPLFPAQDDTQGTDGNGQENTEGAQQGEPAVTGDTTESEPATQDPEVSEP